MAYRIDYHAYIQSEEWKRVREKALIRAGHKCQLCAGTYGLEVHHNTYERLGRELPTDLVTLCGPCHLVFHIKRDQRTAKKIVSNIPVSERPKKIDRVVRKVRQQVSYCGPNPPLVSGYTETIVVDEVFLNSIRLHSAFTQSGLALFGIPWPPPKGWMQSILGKTFVVDSESLRLAREYIKCKAGASGNGTRVTKELANQIAEDFRQRLFTHSQLTAEKFGVASTTVKRISREYFGDAMERLKHLPTRGA